MAFAQLRLDFNIYNVNLIKIALIYKTDSTLFQETKIHFRRAVYEAFTVFDPVGHDAATFLRASSIDIDWVVFKTGMG